MNRKQHTLTIVLSLVAGLVGGVVSTQLFMGQPVFAEKKPTHQKVLRAERFELVDKEGFVWGKLEQMADGGVISINFKSKGASFANLCLADTLAVVGLGTPTIGTINFTVDENGSQLRLFNQDNKLGAVFGSIDLKIPRTGEIIKRPISSIVLFDEDENVLWKAP